jgi:hypothetical protein
MRKTMLVIFGVMLAVSVAAAQTYSGNSTGGLTGIDVLGAHNNGGRGCAGCHAPHSGAAGGGGNAVAGAKYTDTLSGSNALFGQDVSPLFGVTLTFATDGGYVEALPGQAAAYTTNTSELRQIMMCLACHDGVIAKGQMMQGTSWEQSNNLLPAGVYGPNGIPTLLGNDNGNGNTSGYGNDHPVGTQATLGKLRLVSAGGGKPTDPLTVTMNGTSIASIVPTPGTTYANFAANYGYPAIAGSPWEWGFAMPNGSTDPSTAFMTCTTCHNQHVMYVYAPPRGKQAGTAIAAGTAYPTYFFVNAPYNPGAGNNSPTLAASTTQFCRQCHIGEANESAGVNNVKTQF